MAVDPLTAKILAKVAMQAATDSESRKRILFIHIIASAPEFSAPIFVLQFSKFLVQHRAALSLQVSHKSRHRHLRWNLYQNMNMVRAHLPFQETNSFPFTQLPQDFSYFCSFFLIEYFSPVLGCKHYMVLAVPFCVR